MGKRQKNKKKKKTTPIARFESRHLISPEKITNRKTNVPGRFMGVCSRFTFIAMGSLPIYLLEFPSFSVVSFSIKTKPFAHGERPTQRLASCSSILFLLLHPRISLLYPHPLHPSSYTPLHPSPPFPCFFVSSPFPFLFVTLLFFLFFLFTSSSFSSFFISPRFFFSPRLFLSSFFSRPFSLILVLSSSLSLSILLLPLSCFLLILLRPAVSSSSSCLSARDPKKRGLATPFWLLANPLLLGPCPSRLQGRDDKTPTRGHPSPTTKKKHFQTCSDEILRQNLGRANQPIV